METMELLHYIRKLLEYEPDDHLDTLRKRMSDAREVTTTAISIEEGKDSPSLKE